LVTEEENKRSKIFLVFLKRWPLNPVFQGSFFWFSTWRVQTRLSVSKVRRNNILLVQLKITYGKVKHWWKTNVYLFSLKIVLKVGWNRSN
jgi:hypothetical protein